MRCFILSLVSSMRETKRVAQKADMAMMPITDKRMKKKKRIVFIGQCVLVNTLF